MYDKIVFLYGLKPNYIHTKVVSKQGDCKANILFWFVQLFEIQKLVTFYFYISISL